MLHNHSRVLTTAMARSFMLCFHSSLFLNQGLFLVVLSIRPSLLTCQSFGIFKKHSAMSPSSQSYLSKRWVLTSTSPEVDFFRAPTMTLKSVLKDFIRLNVTRRSRGNPAWKLSPWPQKSYFTTPMPFALDFYFKKDASIFEMV